MPLELYFRGRHAKVLLALGRGKKGTTGARRSRNAMRAGRWRARRGGAEGAMAAALFS